MRFGMSDEREPAVVRDVEPLVRVGRPRVGLAHPLDEMAELGRRGGPQPERAVDVEPGARRPRECRDLGHRIHGARVHLADLRADHRRAVTAGKRRLHRIRAHSTLVIHRHRHGRRGTEPEKAQRAIHRHMALPADEHADGRRTAQPIALDIPAGALEHRVPSGREAGHMGHLTTRHEGERGRRRKPEQLLEPLTRHLLDHGGGRAGDDEARVLVPGARQPVGRQRGRKRRRR